MGAIEVRGLRKRYGHREAVAGVDLSVEAGEVVAILGPNGAGKTTTVEVLEGYRRRSGGKVSVLGFDPETGGTAFRRRVGIVLQSGGFDPELTVAETVALYASLYPSPRSVAEALALVGLERHPRKRVATLSGGQQRRLDLAVGIVGRPQLLFLDEPTTGFDPEARRRAWEVILGLRQEGTTVVLTTHYLDEARRLADRVVVLVAGRIVADGPPDEVGGALAEVATVSFRLPRGASPADLPRLPDEPEVRGDEVVLRTARPTLALAALAPWARARGTELPGLSVARPTLEDAYMSLVSKEDPRG